MREELAQELAELVVVELLDVKGVGRRVTLVAVDLLVGSGDDEQTTAIEETTGQRQELSVALDVLDDLECRDDVGGAGAETPALAVRGNEEQPLPAIGCLREPRGFERDVESQNSPRASFLH